MDIAIDLKREYQSVQRHSRAFHQLRLVDRLGFFALSGYALIAISFSKHTVRHANAIYENIQAVDSTQIIDPKGKLDNNINLLLSVLENIYGDNERVYQMATDYEIAQRLAISRSQRNIRQAYETLEACRLYIMEHDVDADKSPDSGPFDSIDDLMKHLNA